MGSEMCIRDRLFTSPSGDSSIKLNGSLGRFRGLKEKRAMKINREMTEGTNRITKETFFYL